MSLKLSRVSVTRDRAEKAIDRYYARMAAEEMGPASALHALKRENPDAWPDADDIRKRAAEQFERLVGIDQVRRFLKHSVRAATSSDEIRAILANTPIRIVE